MKKPITEKQIKKEVPDQKKVPMTEPVTIKEKTLEDAPALGEEQAP